MNASLPLVIAVVLNWNKAEQSAKCVSALRCQHYPNLRIIVVDNGSAEGSLAALEDLSIPFILLRNKCNLGFAGGVNVGIGRALADGADYIWLLNNDAEAAPDVLDRMLPVLEADSTIGLASPLIRNGDANDEIEFCGGLWQNNSFDTTDDPLTYLAWAGSQPRRIWLVATAVLLRRSAVEKIGLFDEQLFAYWEDNDYSVRSIKAGFRNVVVPEAVVRHWSGRPKTDAASKPPHYYYYMARNEILFIRKYGSLPRTAKPLYWALMRQLTLAKRLHDYEAGLDAILCGLRDGALRRGGAFGHGKHVWPVAIRLLRLYARPER
nr:glycosyltransferase family 2 protein [uncultured Rhodopila sp.]